MKKKLLAMLLVGVMAFSLSACSSANTDEPASGTMENSENPSGSENDTNNSELESDTEGVDIDDDTEVDPDVGVDTEGENNTDGENNNDGSNSGTETPEVSEEEKLWADRVIANVTSGLNVRKGPSSDAAVVGNMEPGAYGVVVEKGEEWTKIISGTVEGYIATKYCLFGEEARDKVAELSEKVAIVNGNSLRLRDAASTKGHVMTTLSKGEELIVNASAKTNDGWVAVYYGEGTYYLSADYVILTTKEKTALTTAETKALNAAEAKLKAKQEKALLKAKQQIAMDEATDLEILATIIWCEAGAEPYEAQLAVGAVVMNRVESKRYPNTIRGVLVQKGQFEPIASGWFIKALMRGDASQSCYKAAKAALAGEDNTNGCIGFWLASTGHEGIIYGKIVFFGKK